MSFTDRLEYLMKKNGIKNKSELARVSDIPYTTIDGFYKKGSDNIKLSTLRKLAFWLHDAKRAPEGSLPPGLY